MPHMLWYVNDPLSSLGPDQAADVWLVSKEGWRRTLNNVTVNNAAMRTGRTALFNRTERRTASAVSSSTFFLLPACGLPALFGFAPLVRAEVALVASLQMLCQIALSSEAECNRRRSGSGA